MEIANEGIFSNFFTKFKSRKEKADETHGSGKPMTFNEMANTSYPKRRNYTDLSNKIKEMYPAECEKEFKLRKAYLKEVLRMIPKFDKEFSKYGVETKRFFELNRQISTGTYKDDEGDDRYLNNVLNNDFPYDDMDEEYFIPGFMIPVCTFMIWEFEAIAPDNLEYQETLDTSKWRTSDLNVIFWDLQTRIISFIDKYLSDSQCYGGVCMDGDYDGGNYHVIIVPSDQMIDLAIRVSSDPEEKKDLKMLKDYKKYMKKVAVDSIKKGSELPKEMKALLGVK